MFPFELDDTSLQGETRGADSGDLARLARLDAKLREALARSGRYSPVAVPTDPSVPSWWTCDGCEVDLARKAGAKFSVVGWVQKVSNLILNINIVMRDVGTGKRIAAGSVDIRGDTDEVLEARSVLSFTQPDPGRTDRAVTIPISIQPSGRCAIPPWPAIPDRIQIGLDHTGC